MTNAITVFNNDDFGSVRIVLINGEPWFVGKDVAEVLGYANASKALADHVDEEDKLNNESLSSLGQRGGWLVNESGLYSLVFSSKLPRAKEFKHWVTAEVLPSIRKTGSYSKPLSINEMILEMAKANVEQEHKMLLMEQKQVAIETKQTEQDRQIEIINSRLDTFNGVEIANSREQLRHKLNAYCYKAGIQQSKAWNIFKQAFNDAYNTNINLLITNYTKANGLKKSPTCPEYLEKTDQLADAHAVLDKLMN